MKKLIGFLVIAAFLTGMGLGSADLAQAAAAPKYKWKLQSANPAGAPQIQLLNRWADNIYVMSGERLKIEILAAGAIVKSFEILDGVNKGIVEAGQWWTHYSMGKNPSGSLFSSPVGGAGSGLDLMNHLSWYFNGGGRELYVEYYQKIINTDVMPFLFAPDGPEAFGWTKTIPKTLNDYLKMRFRMSAGLSSDVLKDMGGIPVNLSGDEVIPAAERGVIDGVEWINTASDVKLGLQDVFKNYCLQGLHQAIGIMDIVINGKAWRSLPPDLQKIVEVACTQSIIEGILFFVEENAKALQIVIAKGVTIYDAPPGYSEAFIKSAKKVLAQFEQKDPFFKKVLESQREYAKLVVPFTKETNKLGQLIAGAAETK